MSTILKALKKLEENKASQGERKGDIAWDIVREEKKQNESIHLRTYLFLAGVVALVLLGVFSTLLMQAPEPETTSVEYVEPSATPTLARESAREPSVLPVTPVVVQQNTPPVKPAPVAEPPPRGLPAESFVSVDAGGLVLTGIAFQDSEEARLAIVNDLPVMIGTVIDDAIVEQILSDRVVFSRQGRQFSVFLASPE